MRKLKWISLWLSLVSGAIWLTIILTLIVFPLFVWRDNLQDVAGLSTSMLYRDYLKLLAYLQMPWITHLHIADFPMSASGLQHFVDVRHLFIFDIVVFIITTPLAVRFWRELRADHTRFLLVRPFSIGAIVPLIFLGLMAINFDRVFVTFHEVLFRNSDWEFDPGTDPIINVLPEDFFMACFVLALVLFEVALVYGIWRGTKDARIKKS